MAKRGVLIVKTDVFQEIETDWNNWYDTKHIPARLNTGLGFLAARRFVAIERELKYAPTTKGEPKYLTVYDLASVNVLISKAYLKLLEREASLPPGSFEAITKPNRLPNFFRGLYEQIYPEQGEYQPPDTRIIFAVGIDVPSTREEEFNAWYNTEHILAMRRVPGFVTARRFVVAEAQLPSRDVTTLSPKYIALYDLESEEALESDAFRRESQSPWTSWVHSWYSRRFLIVGRRIYPE